jgi:hypothetical protein
MIDKNSISTNFSRKLTKKKDVPGVKFEEP